MLKVHYFLYTAVSFPDFPPPCMLLKPPPQPKVVSWMHPWLYDLERLTDYFFFYWLSYRLWVEVCGSLWNHLACLCLSSPSTKSFHLPCLFWFKQNELKPLKVTFALIAIWTHLVPWSCLGKLKPHNESQEMKQTETSFQTLLSRMFLLCAKDGARLSCIVRKVPYYPIKKQSWKGNSAMDSSAWEV